MVLQLSHLNGTANLCGTADFSPDVWITQMAIPAVVFLLVVNIPWRASMLIMVVQHVNYYMRRK